MKSHFLYELKEPIKIAKDGKEIEATQLIAKCPRPRDRMNAMCFEVACNRSIMKALPLISSLKPSSETDKSTDTPTETEDEKSDSLIKLITMGAEDKDIKEIFFLIGQLLCEGNLESPQCTVEDTKMTKDMFDNLGLEDMKALIGRYAYHFLSLS